VLLVALHRRWFFLAALAAAGTVVMQVGWADKFFEAKRYFEGDKIFIALGVLLGFNVLYLAASWWSRFREKALSPTGMVESELAEALPVAQMRRWFWGSALGFAAVALVFTAWFTECASVV